MKNLISIILISLFVFALKAQNVDSLELLLESKYVEYDSLASIVNEQDNDNYMGCPVSPEKLRLSKLEEEIIKMEKEFKEILDANIPLELNKKTIHDIPNTTHK